ncbi:MAG: hypothetical protein FWH05_00010 [Oscillospiraceae bacterium]|nr:hypothetical protein [Oscillospiraceae bacterium]
MKNRAVLCFVFCVFFTSCFTNNPNSRATQTQFEHNHIFNEEFEYNHTFNQEEVFFSPFGYRDYVPGSLTMYFGAFELPFDYISIKLIDLVGYDKYNEWSENLTQLSRSDKLYIEFYERTSLHETVNLYSFVHHFNIPKEEFIKVLDRVNADETEFYNYFYYTKYFHMEGDLSLNKKYELSDKKIYNFDKKIVEYIYNMNENLILGEFTRVDVFVKEENFYSPIWFYYANADEYIEKTIPITAIVKAYTYFQELHYFDPWGFNFMEYKIHEYSNATNKVLDYTDLFGYDPDFSMPLPYKGYPFEYADSHYAFYGLNNIAQTQNFYVIKDEHMYLPFWFYYNKPEAYREAGITPEELLEMLPKYRALGILRDEAMTALENKVFVYATDVESGE